MTLYICLRLRNCTAAHLPEINSYEREPRLARPVDIDRMWGVGLEIWRPGLETYDTRPSQNALPVMEVCMRHFPLLILLLLSLPGVVAYGQDAPATAKGHLFRGLALAEKGDLSGAIVEYNAAIEIDPRYTTAYNFRGLARERMGYHDEAIADYDKAIGIDPKYAMAYSNRGLAREGKGDRQGAFADYNKAIEVDPKNAYAYNVRGLAREGRALGDTGSGRGGAGDYDGAIADYTKAIEINPGFYQAYYNRALARDAKGDYDGAIADATKVTEHLRVTMNAAQDNELANAYGLRGLAELKLGKDEEAQRDIASAIRLNSRLKTSLEAESAKIKQARRPKE
jgi:tetratricopeptide (TPR) repeat protein